jgi:hypothetical protein
LKIGSDGLCAGCRSWCRLFARGECRGCLAAVPVDRDALCRACVIAIRAETRAGCSVVLPFPRQVRLHVPGLGNHEAWPLPRRSRRDHAPRLEPVLGLFPVDDPRMLPAAVRGQLALFPVRRRLERADFHRFTARSWPEEDVLARLAQETSATWG